MQNKSFDIAGPNPTPEEQKRIDESYGAYLANQHRINRAAEAAAKQQQQQRQQEQQQEQVQQVALHTETERVPVPVERPKQQQAISGDARSRAKGCVKGSFSCEWPRLSESLNELKKLFSPTPSKAKKG